MQRDSIVSASLDLVLHLVEIAAAIRCAFATYRVVFEVTHDLPYTVFTVLVVEGLFVASLFMIGRQITAPISALIALVFSGAVQWLELMVIDGSLTDSDRVLLRAVIAFAPIMILALAYLRRLAANTSVNDLRTSADNFLGGVRRPFGMTRSRSEIKDTFVGGGVSGGERSLNMSAKKTLKMTKGRKS